MDVGTSKKLPLTSEHVPRYGIKPTNGRQRCNIMKEEFNELAQCIKCGDSCYKMGKPFCTDSFCNNKSSEYEETDINQEF